MKRKFLGMELTIHPRDRRPVRMNYFRELRKEEDGVQKRQTA